MYTDFLIKIKNAQKAKKETMRAHFSTMDMAVADILVKHGYLANAGKKGRNPKRIIEVELKYDEDGVGAITDLQFISKPSRRVYAGYKELYPVRQGYGISVISTPKGIMTNQEAKKKKLGGQLLFKIW